MGGQIWEVVGGSKGGILVRTGRELDSPEAASRLSNGALVEEKELKGERLLYRLLDGTGPQEGWVSLKLKGKSLLVKTDKQPATNGIPPWLHPDAAGRKRILFLTMPWKGHIVHLKRIAGWFVGREGFEIHAAIFPESVGVMPEGVTCHKLGEEETAGADLLQEAEDGFRKLAIEARDYKSGIGGFTKIIMKCMAEHTSRGEDPIAMVFRFYFRVCQLVKPEVIVGDGFCNMFDMMQNYCAMEDIKLLLVNSPGIPETWAQEGEGGIVHQDVKSMDDEQLETTAKALGMPKALIQMQSKPDAVPPAEMEKIMASAPRPAEMTLLALIMSLGNAAIAPFMTTPIARKLGMKPAVAGKMIRSAASNPPAPIQMFPSSRALLAALAEPLPGLFTGPFLPLPAAMEGGHVQRGKADFEATLAPMDPKLLEWLYEGDGAKPIVYVAFGSIVRPNAEIVGRVVEALDGGDWRVLWALPQELHSLLPKKLDSDQWHIESFVPQADVLKCDRVRCFISHNGANSTVESLACGVPMVSMPYYMDQYDWARVVCKHRTAGIQVDKFGPPGELRDAVARVLGEPQFREGALEASRVMRAQEEAVLQRLGQAMAPPSQSVGCGVSVAAALILAFANGGDFLHVFKVIEESYLEVTTKLGASGPEKAEESAAA